MINISLMSEELAEHILESSKKDQSRLFDWLGHKCINCDWSYDFVFDLTVNGKQFFKMITKLIEEKEAQG